MPNILKLENMRDAQPEISIIVPVYNAELYLHKCIDSILSQTFHNFELLLINDGSVDRSGDICDEYCRIDKRVKVIHKVNGGVSSARNLGIEKSRGKYLSFIDSDDWVENHYISTLYNSINEETDLSIGWLQLDNTSEDWLSRPELYTIRFNPALYPEKIINNAAVICKATANLYKRKLVVGNSIVFPTQTYHMEDVIFSMLYLLYCKHIAISGGAIYHYNRANQNSITHTTISNDAYLESIHKVYDCISKMEKKFKYDYSSLYINLCGEAYYALLKGASTLGELRQLSEDYAIKHLCTIYPKRMGRSMKIYSLLNRIGMHNLGSKLLWSFRKNW